MGRILPDCRGCGSSSRRATRRWWARFFHIDDTSTGARPAHSTLLAANIPIVEHLCNLDALPDSSFPVLCRTGEGESLRHFSGTAPLHF